MTLNGFGPVFSIVRRNQREMQLRSYRCLKQQCGGFRVSVWRFFVISVCNHGEHCETPRIMMGYTCIVDIQYTYAQVSRSLCHDHVINILITKWTLCNTAQNIMHVNIFSKTSYFQPPCGLRLHVDPVGSHFFFCGLMHMFFSLIFCKFLVGVSRFVAGMHPLASPPPSLQTCS
jgi:hypothetical protein